MVLEKNQLTRECKPAMEDNIKLGVKVKQLESVGNKTVGNWKEAVWKR